jgi:predicted Co/Zn/Cd cation transporter (cation efflux family)
MKFGLVEVGVIASLLLNVGVALVGATLGIGRIKEAVRSLMDDHSKEYDTRLEAIARAAGENYHAIRQKVHELELVIRDEFVRVRSFEVFATRVEKQLDRLEEKIDSNAERDAR